MPRNYSAADGHTVRDLLHYGLDHLSAARHLLNSSASWFDSAGYLAHIAVELLLKAWHLEVFGSFPAVHSLLQLWTELSEQPDVRPLAPGTVRTLALLDQYEKLRYPNLLNQIEIGSEHIVRIDALIKALHMRMPLGLSEAREKIDVLQKGGRLLMKRPKRRSKLSLK